MVRVLIAGVDDQTKDYDTGNLLLLCKARRIN